MLSKFEVRQGVQVARLQISALGLVEAEIDGAMVDGQQVFSPTA